jgi:hypothetical protein
MKVIAKQIGKSQKESISIDGKVFLKSVAVGRWTHVVKLSYTNASGIDHSVIGKSASYANAAKWQHSDLFFDLHPKFGKESAQEIKDHQAAGRGAWVQVRRPFSGINKVYRIPFTNISREIVEVTA